MSGHRYRHPIYGTKRRVVIRPAVSTVSSETYCYDPCPGLLDVFIAFEREIYNTERALQQFYQPTRAVSEFIAKMSARCTVPPVIFVRLMWRQTQTGVSFDINNPMHRLQIKYIYAYFEMDHRADPLFKDALGLTLA